MTEWHLVLTSNTYTQTAYTQEHMIDHTDTREYIVD